MQRGIVVLVLLPVSFLLPVLWAQSTDAVVSGTVLDPSGAPVADAMVSMRNVATGVVNDTSTNGVGVYLFGALQPGKYQLTAERAGFQKYINEGVVLEVGSRLNINVPLQLGSTTETVEVSSQVEALETSTSTVGTVVTNQKLLDLPLVGRNAYDFVLLQAGVSGENGQNFNGTRAGALNLTLDGINIRENALDALAQSTTLLTVSVDRVQEFRVITSPADAEYGRGAGQIQAISRSGTNQFHGGIFEENRVTALSANTWFNNQRGSDPATGEALSPRNLLVRNQFGGRLGGPIRHNRTFFNVHYEGSRQVSKNALTSVTYTESARQGLYRFFPGVRNANAIGTVPTVDINGNPVRPAGAAGDLQSVSLFGRDPNRMTGDPSGIIARQMALMPLPNNFRAGDGLNTAGFTFQRRISYAYDSGDIRIDHQFSSAHRLGFSYSRQESESLNIGAVAQNFPAVPATSTPTDSRLWSVSLISVLRPTLLNEFRAGVYRPRRLISSIWEQDPNILPKASGVPFVPAFVTVSSPIAANAYGITDASGRVTPVYQFGDNVTWLRGRHSFKGGFEFRFNSYAGYTSFVTVPRVSLGASTIPVQNINSIAIPGLGFNQAAAQQILAELSGSVSNAFMYLNSPGGKNPVYLPGQQQYHHLRQPEFSWFFKDDLKVNANLTLNLGVRYDWYGVPVEADGLGLGVVGGSAGLFGISGTSMAALFRPGLMEGSLTNVQQIGPGTPNPNTRLYNNNNLNFSPAVGVTWTVPGENVIFGRGKTVLRAGYMTSYERLPYQVALQAYGGTGYTSTSVYVPSNYVTVGNLQLPLAPSASPLSTVPLTDRNQTIFGFDDHLRPGYYQNWNFSIQRSLSKNLVLEARYVGNKGTNLVRAVSMNETNIFENGILDAFNITQAGGNAPLFDKMFMGIGGVNGTTVRGSDYLRANPTTQAYFAANNPGGLAGFINTGTLAGPAGQLLRRAGLPENFVVVNPQFGQNWLIGNFGNSSYHALQAELTKRFADNWVLQGNYTWSKALGDEVSEDSGFRTNFRTLRNRSLDKKILGLNRTHALRVNTLWELPFGPGKLMGRNARGILARLLGGWQAGAIAVVQSGQPISLYGVNAYNVTGNVNADEIPSSPMAAAALPKDMGQVQKTGDGVVYFSGLRQVSDPSISNIGSPAIRAQSTMLAITDASDSLLMMNPTAGQFGNIAPNFLTGPGYFRVDLNVIKRIKITESKEFVVRADAVNATNSPSFANPNTNINNVNFGRITDTVSGPRVVVFGLRLNF